MKKIRMITFHTPKNYGAVLQAYSLMRYMKTYSQDVKIIDFNTPHLQQLYGIKKKGTSWKQCILLSLDRLYDKQKRKKYKEMKLKHTSTDDVPLDALLKSKYLESDMGKTLFHIHEDLKAGKQVLFCGTPCQCAAMRRVFGECDALLTVDFVCHGVPSSGVFDDYLKLRLRKGEKLLHLDFRPKDTGWEGKAIRLETSKTISTVPIGLDLFYSGFLTADAFLRRSCYTCRYRKTHLSDITIADFWGYREYDKTLNDGKGLSLIVTNTSKGENAVGRLKNFELHEIDNRYSDYAFKEKDYSAGLKNRSAFYALYEKKGFRTAAIRSYCSDYYKRKAKAAVKKLLGRA